MKRLIYLSTLILFVLASCDSPLSDSGKQSSQPAQPGIVSPTNSYSLETVSPDTVRKAAFQQFQAKNGSQWRVRWNEHTGLPASVYSGLSEKKYGGSAEQAARNFLADHAGLFGLSNLEQLKHVKTKRHRGIRHVTFNQTVDGVPVYEAEYKVHLRPGGKVDMANGTYYPNIQVSTTPSVSASQAEQTAISDLEVLAGKDMTAGSELVIYRDGKQFHLAWKLALISREPIADWFYIIDAHSGQIRYKLNQLAHVTGDGDVYPTHPGLSSVNNRSLFRLSGNSKLQGVYAKIINDVSSEATSGSHSFVYSPSNTHFDEVNLYYHIDNFRQNFIENVDDGSLGFGQITAHARTPVRDLDGDGDLDPNAYFQRPPPYPGFGPGELFFNPEHPPQGTNDFAKEDKVIFHEYGHAVIYDIESGIRSENNEEGAISEGTPDYFAGAATPNNRSIIGDYVVPFSFQERDMADPDIDSYSDYQNEPNYPIVESHAGGEFFSSILWDLRGSINPADADFLVYDALYRITGGPTFQDFRDAMIAADWAAYSGTHRYTIMDTFAAKGVGLFSPPDVTIDGPDTVEDGEYVTWTAEVTGGDGPYSYTWYRDGQIIANSSPIYSETVDEEDGQITEYTLLVEVTYTDSETGAAAKEVTVIGEGCIAPGLCP